MFLFIFIEYSYCIQSKFYVLSIFSYGHCIWQLCWFFSCRGNFEYFTGISFSIYSFFCMNLSTLYIVYVFHSIISFYLINITSLFLCILLGCFFHLLFFLNNLLFTFFTIVFFSVEKRIKQKEFTEKKYMSVELYVCTNPFLAVKRQLVGII